MQNQQKQKKQTNKSISQNKLTIKFYNQFKLYPQTIHHLSYNSSKKLLTITRSTYTQIFKVSKINNSYIFQDIFIADKCRQAYIYQHYLILIKQFYIQFLPIFNNQFSKKKRTFNTQCNHSYINNNIVYTLHVNQLRKWIINQDTIDQKIILEGGLLFSGNWIVEASGKIVKYQNQIIRYNRLITSILQIPDYLIIGSSQGHISFYSSVYNILSCQFKQLQAPVLCILYNEKYNILYITGCDSKIVSFKVNQNNNIYKIFQIRGQSHDIYSLIKIQEILLSGGLTTDLCLYKLEQGNLKSVLKHENLLSSTKLIDYNNKVLLVNHGTSIGLYNIQQPIIHLIQIQCKQNQYVKQCVISPNLKYIVMVCEQRSYLFELNQRYQIMNHKQFVTVSFPHFNSKNKLICWKNNSVIKLSFKQKLKQKEILSQKQVYHPSHLIDLQNKKNILIGSKIQHLILLYSYAGLILKNINTQFYFLSFMSDCIIYSQPQQIHVCHSITKLTNVVKIDANKIKFGCLFPGRNHTWLGFAQAAIYSINSLTKSFKSKKKRVIKIKTQRIYQIIYIDKMCLGLMGINYRMMLNQKQMKAIINKRIR